MSSVTEESKSKLESHHSDWLSRVGAMMGVSLGAATPPPVPSATREVSKSATTQTLKQTSDSRQVKAGGGYTFEQHADGKIFIVESPKNGKTRIEVKDSKGYNAILKEIGPFPKTGAGSTVPAPPKLPLPPVAPIGPPKGTAPASGGGIFDKIFDAVGDAAGALKEAVEGKSSSPTGASPSTTPSVPPVLEATRVVTPPDSYRNQRDNPELGDTTCNVTSLAMQLLSLAKGDETKLRTTAVSLLKARGVTASADTQIEELLRQLAIKVAGGEKVTLGTGEKATQHPSWQVAFILDKVSELFTDYVSKTETIYPGFTQKGYEDMISPALAQGAAVMLSTKLTNSGHIVELESVEAAGIVINDPFGCRTEDGYLKNAGDVTAGIVARIRGHKDNLDSRLKQNSDLRKALDDLAAAGKGNYQATQDERTSSLGMK